MQTGIVFQCRAFHHGQTESAPLAALRLSNLEEVQVMFYFVNIPDRQTQAWVPGWCIQGTAAPEPTPAP